MIYPTADDYRASGLYDTALAARLKEDGVAFVDVGSRGGSKDYMTPWRGMCRFTGFDADASAADTKAGKEAGWQDFELLSECLWSKAGKVPLHITASAVNTSILKPAQNYVERYNLRGFDIVKTQMLNAITLDQLAWRYRRRFPEVMKIDTQGAELNIFQGGAKALRDNVEVIISEVLFFPVYENAPVFSDIEAFLAERGFTFYGFIEQNFRATRRIDKREGLQRERLFHADGVFFRAFDRIESQRGYDIQFMMALALCYYDYALELVDASPMPVSEKTELRSAVASLAKYTALRFRAEIDQQLKEGKGLADLMHAMDLSKDLTTYNEVK